MSSERSKSLEGKSIIWLGDSITHDGLFIEYVQKATGLSTAHNYGWHGLPFFAIADNVDGEELSKVDFVCLFAGTNDYGGSRNLGSLNDARPDYENATESFHFEVFNVLHKLLGSNPHAKIVVCTPLKRGKFEKQPVYPYPNTAGFTLAQYALAIRNVCNLFSVPICDLYELKEFEPQTVSNYTRDNLHINEAGAIIVGRLIANALIDI